MIEQMTDCGPPLTLEDITRFEQKAGITLPDDYKSFLLRYNGGIPFPRMFPIEGMPKNRFGGIQDFFGLGLAIESSNLDWNYEVMNGRLPANLLAIAQTGCGDLICLSLFGEDTGSVVFWDHEAEHIPPTYANVYRVAGTFQEFLDSVSERTDAGSSATP